MENITSVFVYGTLKEGQSNHRVARRAGRHTLELATLWEHQLYDLGPFPAVVPGPGYVMGELLDYGDGIWEALGWLDRLEGFRGHGNPHNHYNRVELGVTVHRGTAYEDGCFQTVRCWTYLYNHDLTASARIVEGEWVYGMGLR